MGQKARIQIAARQRVKRFKRRAKLKKAGKKPEDFFTDGTYCPRPEPQP